MTNETHWFEIDAWLVDISPIVNWTNKTSGDWYADWDTVTKFEKPGMVRVYFANPKHAFLFSIRWADKISASGKVC